MVTELWYLLFAFWGIVCGWAVIEGLK